ncbi:MAG: peptide deformylase, partial [Candidatus Berkelbacteria bacterium]|nr:peptide deformylase [Candidatus Berkelbacteria bacterium]
MILPILKIPSKGLYQKSQEISRIDDKIIQLSKDVLETKRANFGVGLAAPQVGKLMRIIVLGNLEHQEKKELKIPEQILINPFIVKKSSETEIADEGCLSLPGLTGKVSRHKEINIKATSLEIIGNKTQTKKIQFKAKNFQARVIQHEIDHLDGILFSDKVEDVKTIKRIPTPYKIVFLGTPEFAVPVLESLIKNNWSISLVITEPDKPVGRKQILTPPPIKKIASKYKLLVYQPEKLSSIKSSLKNLQPDVIILAAYGKILPKEIVDAPLYGSLCLHPSLLPKYRGPSPIQEMILSDEKQIGATLFKMDEKVDHGPIIAN